MPESADFEIGEVQRRLSLQPVQPGDAGDFTFNRDLEDMIRHNATIDAAVLIGLHKRPALDSPMVVMTQRTASLRTHSGQIAFPGGRIDEDDRDAVDAALRECEEETGIARRHTSVIGTLPVYLSGSGFRIRPVVAYLQDGFEIAANPDEVEMVFDVPLSFLMDPANHKTGSRMWNGRQRYFYEMPYGERHIWGVTAGIIRLMYERLYA
jgi:8-oxo-dGTP pyrophosphatase MutT (NUDIX family)